jgi:DNA mismatch repair ATPase MutS
MPTEAQMQGLGSFASHGFTLETPDDHIAVLLHNGEKVAVFSQTGTTEESIQAECARHMATKHGWEGVLWQAKTTVL